MPHLGFLLTLLLGIASPPATTPPAPTGPVVEAVSFNIRYGTARDGEHAWLRRREAVLAFIGGCGADFIGLQEALAFQTREVREAVGDRYGILVRTREASDGDGEATPLLYRRDRWRLDPERNGTFWLSETPDVPGSRSWDSSLPRIATWGRFIELDGSGVVWVVNTHFDHRSAAARAGAARLIAERLGNLVPVGEPVVVMGDFNAVPDSAPLKALRSGSGRLPRPLLDTWSVRADPDTAPCTFNGWGEGLAGRRIDYVLAPVGTEVLEASILRERIEGRPISDHWPVRARMRLPAGGGG